MVEENKEKEIDDTPIKRLEPRYFVIPYLIGKVPYSENLMWFGVTHQFDTLDLSKEVEMARNYFVHNNHDLVLNQNGFCIIPLKIAHKHLKLPKIPPLIVD